MEFITDYNLMDPSPVPSSWTEQLGKVYGAAVRVAGAHNVDEALQTIVDSAREIAGAELGALGVPGEPGEPMAHFVISGIRRDHVNAPDHAPMGRGVLGVLLTGGESVRLANLADHAAYLGYPDTHPHIHAFLGVPIRSGGEVVGDLYLGNKIGGFEFTETDQRLIEMLAAHASAVIQGLRYHKRAAELARLREHEEMSMELHDHVLQTLYGTGLLLGQIDLSDHPVDEARLREVQVGLGQAIDHLRAQLLRLTAPSDPE